MKFRFLASRFLFFLVFIAVSGVLVTGEGKPKNSSEAQFLDRFTEHHLDAIKMSELAKTKVENPKLKEMAEEMASKQSKEVEQMTSWRTEYFSALPKVPSKMPKMDLKELQEKSGKDFDVAFIDLMRKHHTQGISMAKRATDELFHSNIKDFVENAIHDQDRERQQLAQLKKEEISQGENTK